jgi:crossover junction endodeoxyribonuclease RuvC
MRILGVDPGTRATGWGVVEHRGGVLRHLGHGVVRTSSKDALWHRLSMITAGLREVVAQFQPDVLSLERCFVAKNARSALLLGHARGAIMVLCADHGMDVAEYAPSQIKSAVTGHGRADKRQVAEMVRVLMTLPSPPPSDAADALGAAICHAHAPPISAMPQEVR